MLGLRRGTVALYPHETEWEAEAARTIRLLKEILGDAAGEIRHVGSTAIRSIKAKPIVDIAVAAADFDRVLALREPLERAGFYYRPGSLEGQLLFARGSYYDGTGDLQTHFIHVVKAGGADWYNYIRFRDYLNANPAAAKAYEALKVSLARECPADAGREHYLAGKHDFIRRTLRDAAAWAFLGQEVHLVVDRPVGYVHKTGAFETVYPVNYGYLPGVPGGDGEEQDAYLLGVDEPVAEADAVVIGVVRRYDDAEDKLIAAPAGVTFTKEQMENAVRFQEQWFKTEIMELSRCRVKEEKGMVRIESVDPYDEAVGEWIDSAFDGFAGQNGLVCHYVPFAFAAKRDGKVIGVIKGHSFYREVHVGELIVAEEYRGKGLGTRLLEMAEAHFQGRGFDNINLTTYRFQAPGFYQKCGFTLEFIRENPDCPALAKYFFVKKIEG